MSAFYGSNVTELPTDYGFDPRSGIYSIRKWRGTPAAVSLQADAAKLLGLKYDVTPDRDEGGYNTIRVWYGAIETQNPDEPLSDLWSLDGNQIDKSLWNIAKVKDTLANLSVSDVSKVKKDVEDVVSGEADFTADDILNGLPLTVDKKIISDLISALCRGEESKPISQYVLRRVRTVPFNTNIKPNYTGVNKIITTASLKAAGDPGAKSIPGTLLFELPEGFWAKQTPTVRQVTSTTWEITEEWWFAERYDPFVWDTYG